jgi:oligosaccharide repeat unit polymerase
MSFADIEPYPAPWRAGRGALSLRPIPRPLHFTLTGLVVIAGHLVLALGLYHSFSTDTFAVLCSLGAAGLIVYARHALRLRWTSASIVYLMLLWVFHFGLVFTAALVPDVLNQFEYRTIEWLFWPNARVAMVLGLLATAGFVAGLGAIDPGRATNAGPVAGAGPAGGGNLALYRVGWLLMLGGIGAALLALVRSGGLGIFSLGYLEFRSLVLAPTGLFALIQVSQLGCLFALCGAEGRRWVRPLAIWLVFGALLLLLGLRNEAMIPIITFAIVLMHRGVRFRRGLVAAAAALSLLILPAIGAVRTTGLRNLSAVDWTDVSPIGAFVELGGTLRAVGAYVDWIDQGDGHLLGASYLAPFDRHLLVWVVPGREHLPIRLDTRVPGQFMVAREGSVGTAASGEAYYNFGPIGPVLFFALVGLLFGWLERRGGAGPFRLAVLGIVMFAFYWNIRAEWIQLPAQIAASLLLLAACRVWRIPSAGPPPRVA